MTHPPANPKVLAIVRALNEGAAVGRVVRDLERRMPDVDILVVDDGSTDDTAAVARAAGARVVSLPYNLGMGGAVQTGYRVARDEGYGVAVQVDGDGQHPGDAAADVRAALAASDVDVMVGSRFATRGGYRSSPLRRGGIRVVSRVVSLVTGQPVSDATSGLRAVGPRGIALFAESYPHDYVEIESLLLAARHGLRLGETPVRMRPRAAGRSTITPGRSALYGFRVVLGIAVALAGRRVRQASA